MKEARDSLSEYKKNITWCTSGYEAAKGSDAVVILTEWNQFRALNMQKLKESLKQNIIICVSSLHLSYEFFRSGLS